MRLAILTPFEGKDWALDRWLDALRGALRGAALPEGTILLWLCNAIGDQGFSLRVQEATVSMPAILWHDATRIEEATAMIAKDSTVSRLWRELRARLPDDVTHALCLEDDVIVGATTIMDLLALCPDEMSVVGAPVPEYVPSGLCMAWLHIGDPATAQCAPIGSAPAEVDALSFGCTLFPRSLFDALSLKPGKDRQPPFWGYDNCAGEEVGALGGKIIAAWNVPVEHLARPWLIAPARSSSLPAGSVFSTPEREWLRLAALSTPPWSTMQAIARTALDYGKLRQLAGLHQLNGVVAWRLLDDRMDGVAPNIVRDSCQKHLDNLAWANGKWWAQVGQFCDALEERGTEYVVHGGPVQYAPLGIQHFPRIWEAIDIEVRVESEDEIDAIAEATGSTRHRWFPAWSTLTMPDGLEVGLGCELNPETNDIARSAYSIWSESRVLVQILGREMPIPSLPFHVLRMAGYHTWNNVTSEARRLPLWALARLAAWTQHEAWSWDAFSDVLKRVEDAHGKIAPRNAWADAALHRRNSHTWSALWVLGIADRVYGLLGGRSVASLVSPLDVLDPIPITIGERFDQPGKQFAIHACRWNWPGDEEMLFDYQLVEGYEERVAAGLWSDEGRKRMKHYLTPNGARRYESEGKDAV